MFASKKISNGEIMITRKQIYDKIKQNEQANEKYVEYETNRLYSNIFPEVEQNVLEWLENKPLTDIKIKGVSINDIMNTWENMDFINSVIALKKLKTNRKEGETYLINFGTWYDDSNILLNSKENN